MGSGLYCLLKLKCFAQKFTILRRNSFPVQKCQVLRNPIGFAQNCTVVHIRWMNTSNTSAHALHLPHARAHRHTHSHSHTYTHTQIHTQTHTPQTHTQTHRLTDTHTLTHTHTHPVTHPRPQRTHVPLDTVGSLTVVSLSLLRSCEAAQHYFATGQTFMFIVPLSSLLIVPFLLCSQTAYLHDHLPLPHVHQRKECLHSLRCVQSMRGMDSDPHM